MTAKHIRRTKENMDAPVGLQCCKSLKSSLEGRTVELCHNRTTIAVLEEMERMKGKLAKTEERLDKLINSSSKRTQARLGTKEKSVVKRGRRKATPVIPRRHLNRETFPVKLLKLLEAGYHADVIHWVDDGATVVIKDKEALEKVLPQYFDHGNIRSLHRQFSCWGFTRRHNRNVSRCNGKGSHEYWYHPNFYRGMPRRRLYTILRTANKGTSSRRGGITVNLKKAAMIFQESGETVSTLEQDATPHVGRSRNMQSGTGRKQVLSGSTGSMASNTTETCNEIDQDKSGKPYESFGKNAETHSSNTSVELMTRIHSANNAQISLDFSDRYAETSPVIRDPLLQLPTSLASATSIATQEQGNRKTTIPGVLSNIRSTTTEWPSHFIDRHGRCATALITSHGDYDCTNVLLSSMRESMGLETVSLLDNETAMNHYSISCPHSTEFDRQRCQVYGSQRSSMNMPAKPDYPFSVASDPQQDILQSLPIVDIGCDMFSLEEEDCMSLQDADFVIGRELFVEGGIQIEQV